jgi:cysteine synthase A
MGAGTGGTVAGVGAFLKQQQHQHADGSGVRVYLVDPPGSVGYHAAAHGVAYAPQQAERGLRRHRYDTIIEGVGTDRLTANLQRALPHLDGAFACSDQEAVSMARHLLAADGLFVGGSSAMNCVGAVKAARMLSPGSTVVTVLCDSGWRHLSRFLSDSFLRTRGLDAALPFDFGEAG